MSNLPDTNIYLARMFGSLVKGTFGKYQGKWKGREFSDVDVLFVVKDGFNAPKSWKIHFKRDDWGSVVGE